MWYDGGTGWIASDPILVRGAAFLAEAEAAKQGWLAAWLGTPDTDWHVISQVRHDTDDGVLDEIVVGFPDGQQRTYFFDVTESRAGR